MSRLPAELYRPIVEEAHRRDLYSLLFVCRFIKGEAERILYHSIVIDNPSQRVRLRLFQRLIDCSRVQHFVRTLTVKDERFQEPEYWSYLHKVLRALANLKHLHLMCPLSYRLSLKAPLHFACLLSDCAFRLRTLTIGPTQSNDHAALEAQTEVEELNVLQSVPQFSDETFPALSILSCSARQMTLFPSACRKVSRLEWISDVPEPFCPPLDSVRSFCIHLHSSSKNLLSIILRPFLSLRYFKCMIFFDGQTYGPQKLVSELALINLPVLEKIYLDISIRGGAPDMELSVWQPESLRVVTVQISPTKSVEWVRGKDGCAFVPSSPGEWKDICWVTSA